MKTILLVKTQYDKIEKYYTEHNSSIWQMFEESPDWVHNQQQNPPRL